MEYTGFTVDESSKNDAKGLLKGVQMFIENAGALVIELGVTLLLAKPNTLVSSSTSQFAVLLNIVRESSMGAIGAVINSCSW